jgi:dTDP-4-dehydrorhamnose reductase
MEELLIVGVESVAGSNLALSLEDRFHLSGVALEGAPALEGLDIVALDRGDLPGLAARLGERPPAWIVFCPLVAAGTWDLAAQSQPVVDESPTARLLADWSAGHDAQLTVVATDAVFAGPRMFHDEDSPALATGPVAEAAGKLEAALADTAALVARTHVYGWSPRQNSFCEQLWSAAVDRRPVAVDGRRHATPILASDLAEFLLRARQLQLRGLWHIAGAERTSPYRFACELATALGLPAAPAAQCDEDVAVLDQMETSLCSRRARRKLEMPLPMLGEGLDRFAAQADSGWRDRLRGESWDPATPTRFAA